MTCYICHFETEFDDVVVVQSGGSCICLRCFAYATDGQRHMPKDLRRQVMAALTATNNVG